MQDLLRRELYDGIKNNSWTLAESLKRMRKIVRMTQVEYARLVGVAPRIVIDLERGVGNPTLASLEKLGRPFGLVCGW